MINPFKIRETQQYHDGTRVTYEVFQMVTADGSGSETTKRYLSSILVPHGQDIDTAVLAQIQERGWA